MSFAEFMHTPIGYFGAVAIIVFIFIKNIRKDNSGSSVEIDTSKADQFKDNGEYDKAIDAYRSLINENPKGDASVYNELYHDIAHCFSMKGDHNSAVRYFQDAYQKDPKDMFAAFGIGHEYYWMEDYSNAARYLEKAKNINAKDSETLYFLGDSYLNLGDIKKAKELFEAALKHNPKHADACNGLGRVYDKENNPEMAKKYYDMEKKIDS